MNDEGRARERDVGRLVDAMWAHVDDAFRLARRLTGDAHDAEDVVQDAYLRALNVEGKVAVRNPKPWLLAIVRNTAMTWLAKNRGRRIAFTGDDEVLEAAAEISGMNDAGPEAAVIAAADERALREAVDALPTAFREVVVLRDVNGLSYREIAEMLGVPQGTVMSRLARGRAALIRKLGSRP